MSDISDRLRAHMGKAEIPDILPDCREAADTIDALVKALEKIAAENNLTPSPACQIARDALAAVGGSRDA